MIDETDNELTEAVDELIAGALPPGRREELLRRLVRDPAARDALAEALDLRSAARSAFGYGDADRAMAPALRKAAERFARAGADASAKPGGGRWRNWWRPSRVLNLVAVLVAGVAVWVAVSAHVSSQRLGGDVARLAAAMELPATPPDRGAELERLYRAVRLDANGAAPWLLVSEEGTEFGYLPSAGGTPRGPVLLRCILAVPDGQAAKTMNVLLPAGRPLELLLAQAGSVLGRPLACEVMTDGMWATIGVNVGNGRGGAGVRGRVPIGGRWVEIGEFMLDGRRMRVAVQALPLGRTS